MLHLKRPLVYLYLEVTGKDPQKSPCHSGRYAAVRPGGRERRIDDEVDLLVNPDVGIPALVTRLTGIGPADVQEQPTLAEQANRLAPLVRNADLVGYHAITYDVPLLKAEFKRAGRSLLGPLA